MGFQKKDIEERLEKKREEESERKKKKEGKRKKRKKRKEGNDGRGWPSLLEEPTKERKYSKKILMKRRN